MKIKLSQYQLPIDSMVDKLVDNSKSTINRGFPVVAALIDQNINLLNVEVNTKQLNKKTNYKNHAEFKCYSSFLKQITKTPNKQIIAIITIPPCSSCLDAISKNNINLVIYYLLDDLRNKMDKDYLKKYKANGGQITNMDPSLFKGKNRFMKFELYYIIMVYLQGCLTKKPRKKDLLSIEEIEEISKKWLKKLQGVIRNTNPKKEEVTKAVVWSMIAKAQTIEVERVRHKSKCRKLVWVV